MTNELQAFENKYMTAMAELQRLTKAKKEMESLEKEIKAVLEKAMDKHNIKSIDNDYLKITRVEASSSTSIDLKALKEKEPALHGELLEDYPKVTNRRAYLKFTVK